MLPLLRNKHLTFNVIWCKIHVIYGVLMTETTILPQPWVGFEYHKSTGKSPQK